MRKLLSLLASLAIVASLFLFTATPVFADYSDCTGGSPSAGVGGMSRNPAEGVNWVSGRINPANATFKHCNDPGVPTYASGVAAWVAITPDQSQMTGSHIVQLGIIRCADTERYTPLMAQCKGNGGPIQAFYAMGECTALTGPTARYIKDLDASPHTFSIERGSSNWVFKIDGSTVVTKSLDDISTFCWSHANNLDVSWAAEWKVDGSGFANADDKVNFDSLQYRKNGSSSIWRPVFSLTSCGSNSGGKAIPNSDHQDHKCEAYEESGFAFWSVNW